MRWMARGEDELPGEPVWLSPSELERLGRLRFTKRRQEYLLSRWAAKRTVAALVGIGSSPSELARIEALNHPGGAPYVLVDGEPPGLDVSLTDRAGWAVCLAGAEGSARGGTLGVDLEIVEPRSAGFVRDFLTEAEQRVVNTCDAEERDAAANLLWSAKEAALKVLRVGLRADTRSMEVALGEPARADGWAAMRITGHGQVFPGWWRRDGRFLLTIATVVEADPPAMLPGSADLTVAEPIHSWLANPVT